MFACSFIYIILSIFSPRNVLDIESSKMSFSPPGAHSLKCGRETPTSESFRKQALLQTAISHVVKPSTLRGT